MPLRDPIDQPGGSTAATPMPVPRAARAAIVATLLTGVLAASVFVRFDAIREKVVRSPVAATNGVVTTHTNPESRVAELRTPFAVILRLNNQGASAGRFAVQIDGEPICAATVAAGASMREDCQMRTGWVPGADHRVTIAGPASAWTLDSLELATHHGGTSGLVDVRLVPRGSTAPVRVKAAWIAIGWVVLGAIWLVTPPRAMPRAVRIAYVGLSGVIGLGFTAAIVLPWVSPYGLVLSLGTFVRGVVILAVPRLWSAVTPASRSLRRLLARQGRWQATIAATAVAVIVLAAYARVTATRLDQYGGNYSGFLQIAQDFFDQNPLLEDRADVRASLHMVEHGGYDAQFMYAAAFDPLLRRFHDDPAEYRHVVDAAPYRFGRIGFSLLTWIVTGGHWQWFPAAMVWLILGSIFACALLLGLIARRLGASPAWGAVILLVPGFWQSLQAGLPEPVAAAALLGGYFSVVRERWTAAALCFALSLLIRETGVIFVVCIAADSFLTGRRTGAARVALLALAPLVIWRLYVASVLFSTWGREALFFDPHDLGMPFGGFADLWHAIGRGEYFPGFPEMTRAGHWYPVVLTCGLALAACLFIRRPRPTGAAALIYAAIAVSLTFGSIWVHVGNGQRGTYEMFITLALASVGNARVPFVRAGVVCFWALAAAYVFYGAFDAAFIRAAIL